MSTSVPINECSQSVVFRPLQSRFLTIPQSPVCYWLRERFFELLAGRTLGDVADVCQGLATANDPRFVRFTWEAPPGQWGLPVRNRRWVPFEKGGGYGKWFGHHFWAVDWEYGGARIKAFPASVVRNEQHYFKDGWTYSQVARGSLGFRPLPTDGMMSSKSSGILVKNEFSGLAAILNVRLSSFVARVIAARLDIRESYISRLPMPEHLPSSPAPLESACIALKRRLVEPDSTERTFAVPPSQTAIPGSDSGPGYGQTEAIAAILHTLEGVSERRVFANYGIADEDLLAVLDETGTPAAWFPLIEGYDAFPPLTPALSLDGEGVWVQGLLPDDDARLQIGTADLYALKSRLRNLYEAGPGAKEDVEDPDVDADNDDNEENGQIAVGARIPIPAETFLEELSQRLEIHPISVYWLLKEGIEQDKWRCLPEERRLMKDRFTVQILCLLGHRWPKQVEAGEAVADWADEDGIIPLTEGTDRANLHARLRGRLAANCGEEQVSSEENVFEKVMGKPLGEWVRKDFFRHHVSQFRKRPIAWHLLSAQWSGRRRQEAAFECLLYYHQINGDLLPKLKSQYVIPLLKRLEMELRGLESANGGVASEQKEKKDSLRYRIQELKAFDVVLTEVSSSGFGPKTLHPQLRQHAVNDAMLCLKSRWLKKLNGLIQDGPLADWQKQADQTALHADFPIWITDAIVHLDYHCTVVGPRPPEEKSFITDPTAKDLAGLIFAQAEAMLQGSLRCACDVWWKTFNEAILKPISERIRDAKKELQSLKERTLDPKVDFKEQSDMKRKMNALKCDVKAWQKELDLKSGQGNAVRDVIESWQCPEALTWEPWLARQEIYDQLSSLNGKRPPPQTVAEFIRQESLYQPDINDGVRVNIAPLQKAELLMADMLAGKDVDKAIADRAVWRDDERRWCREGKLPKPGWWE